MDSNLCRLSVDVSIYHKKYSTYVLALCPVRALLAIVYNNNNKPTQDANNTPVVPLAQPPRLSSQHYPEVDPAVDIWARKGGIKCGTEPV